uniref:Uncharacterized protein n=2 Tax=Oncorhynchus tshawytscha TaxID=74940 RepID=A0A8C8GFB9_ONCTS
MASQRRQMMQSHQSWTDDLPLCQMCGVGTAPNCTYGPDGKDTQSHPNEDGHFRFSLSRTDWTRPHTTSDWGGVELGPTTPTRST